MHPKFVDDVRRGLSSNLGGDNGAVAHGCWGPKQAAAGCQLAILSYFDQTPAPECAASAQLNKAAGSRLADCGVDVALKEYRRHGL